MRNSLNILLAIICVGSCSGDVSEESWTLARVDRVRLILESCSGDRSSELGAVKCLEEYADISNISRKDINYILLRDGYNRRIVVSTTAGCVGKNPPIPYSLGKNGVDECGLGDDVSGRLWGRH